MTLGQTFLTHAQKDCGGAVAIDPSKMVKLVAPSFRIGMNGLHGLTLDARIENNGKGIPEFQCIKCGVMLTKDDISDNVVSSCQICGKNHTVKHLFVHKDIPSICEGCCGEIKEHVKGKPGLVRIKDYVENFGITQRNFKVVPLIDVMYAPISL